MVNIATARTAEKHISMLCWPARVVSMINGLSVWPKIGGPWRFASLSLSTTHLSHDYDWHRTVKSRPSSPINYARNLARSSPAKRRAPKTRIIHGGFADPQGFADARRASAFALISCEKEGVFILSRVTSAMSTMAPQRSRNLLSVASSFWLINFSI